jgi:hypothetical protein
MTGARPRCARCAVSEQTVAASKEMGWYDSCTPVLRTLCYAVLSCVTVCICIALFVEEG